MRQMRKGLAHPKMSWSNTKVMLMVFINWKGLVHCGFIPLVQTINKEYDRRVLRHFMYKKKLHLWKEQTLVFLC